MFGNRDNYNQEDNTDLLVIEDDQEDELGLEIGEGQISLDLKNSKLDWFYGIKRKLNNVEAVVEAIPYWKSFVTVAALVSSIATVGLLAYFIVDLYPELPPEFPLIFSQDTNSWMLIDKEILPGVPIALGIVLVLLLRLNSATYKFDRRLAQMVNLGIIIFNILSSIAFVQLVSLILVY